jgi:hypothetical protein
MTFAVQWTGNSGAFSSPTALTLPLNTPVSLPVSVVPTSSGVHTAIVTLTHPTLAGFAHRTQATIVAAEPLTFGNSYRSEKKFEVERPGMVHLYYSVPAGATALRVDVEASKRRVAVAITRPDTRNVNGLRPMENAGRMTYAVLDPSPGVWEVRLQDVDDTRTFDWQQAKKTEAVPNTPVTVTVSALAVEATAATGSNGPSGAADARLTNRLAAFPGAAISLALGSARRDAGSMRGSEQRLYELEVPAGSTWLAARVRSSMADADLDLYAFDCSGKECVAARADGDARGDESVLIANPAAGKWKVVVDASRTGAEGAAFEYEDIIFNPAFGAVSVTDQPKERGAGESWVSRVNTWIAGNLPSGRVPYAGLLVQAQPKGGEPFVVSLCELNRVGERASPSPRN